MWDADSVRRYEEWFDTPEGAFALRIEKRLIESLVSSWQRRGHTLLDAGCGPGIMLEMFWEAGFDVTGLDMSPAMLAATRRRIGARADLHVGSAEHLPFEDNSYDYVALLTVLEFVDSPEKALEEAFRVATRGVLISMLNKWSLYYLTHGASCSKRQSLLREATWHHPFSMRRLVRQAAGSHPLTMRSILPGPLATWRSTIPWQWVNSLLLPFGLGSYAAIRVDLCNTRAVPRLLANANQTAPSP